MSKKSTLSDEQELPRPLLLAIRDLSDPDLSDLAMHSVSHLQWPSVSYPPLKPLPFLYNTTVTSDDVPIQLICSAQANDHGVESLHIISYHKVEHICSFPDPWTFDDEAIRD